MAFSPNKISVNKIQVEGILGTYKRNGNNLAILLHDGKTAEKTWPGQEAFMAGNNEKLHGVFESFSGGGNLLLGGSVGSLSYSTMSFTQDGWFVNKKVLDINDSHNVAYSESAAAGRYIIDGYKITLTLNNGFVKTTLFCFYAKNKTTFRLSGRTFKENKYRNTETHSKKNSIYILSSDHSSVINLRSLIFK